MSSIDLAVVILKAVISLGDTVFKSLDLDNDEIKVAIERALTQESEVGKVLAEYRKKLAEMDGE